MTKDFAPNDCKDSNVFNFIMNTIFIYLGYYQIFEILQPFKGFITYIYILIFPCILFTK